VRNRLELTNVVILYQIKNKETMIKFTFLVQKLPGMSLEEFIDYHKNKHAPLSVPSPRQNFTLESMLLTTL